MSLTAVRNVCHLTFFAFTTTVIFCTLLLGLPLKVIGERQWEAWAAHHKAMFGHLLVNWIQHASPARARLYGTSDEFPVVVKNGRAEIELERDAMVTMNHQVYSDWVFLWWLCYAGELEMSPLIVLKKSLSKVPVFGWGMRFFHFLFLSRKWAQDREAIAQCVNHAVSSTQPLWFVLFPEGTVYNQNTYSKSAGFYTRTFNGEMPFTDLLCPHEKGLHAILQQFNGRRVRYLYDITLAYCPAPPRGHFQTEEFYSLKRTFIKGEGPREVRMHVRKVPLSSVPVNGSDEEFRQWLYKFWQQKDQIYRSLVSNSLESQFRAEAPVALRHAYEPLECYILPLLLGVLIFALKLYFA